MIKEILLSAVIFLFAGNITWCAEGQKTLEEVGKTSKHPMKNQELASGKDFPQGGLAEDPWALIANFLPFKKKGSDYNTLLSLQLVRRAFYQLVRDDIKRGLRSIYVSSSLLEQDGYDFLYLIKHLTENKAHILNLIPHLSLDSYTKQVVSLSNSIETNYNFSKITVHEFKYCKNTQLISSLEQFTLFLSKQNALKELQLGFEGPVHPYNESESSYFIEDNYDDDYPLETLSGVLEKLHTDGKKTKLKETLETILFLSSSSESQAYPSPDCLKQLSAFFKGLPKLKFLAFKEWHLEDRNLGILFQKKNIPNIKELGLNGCYLDSKNFEDLVELKKDSPHISNLF